MPGGKASPERIREVAAVRGYDLDTIEGRTFAEAVAQGLPEVIEDKAVLAAIERISRPRPERKQAS